jgi:hypothetical protein
MGVGQVGNCKTNTMARDMEFSPEQKQLRKDMLTETTQRRLRALLRARRIRVSLVVGKVQTNITDITLTQNTKTQQKMANTKTLK